LPMQVAGFRTEQGYAPRSADRRASAHPLAPTTFILAIGAQNRAPISIEAASDVAGARMRANGSLPIAPRRGSRTATGTPSTPGAASPVCTRPHGSLRCALLRLSTRRTGRLRTFGELHKHGASAEAGRAAGGCVGASCAAPRRRTPKQAAPDSSSPWMASEIERARIPRSTAGTARQSRSRNTSLQRQ